VNAFVLARSKCLPAVVAIPAHNEADWIVRCLTALNRQLEGTFDRAVLLVNNSTDLTTAIARNLQSSLQFPLDVVEHQFPQGRQTAGEARRLAMDLAASKVPAGGVLLCTDADGQVAPDWLAANLFHIRQGADAVAGRAVIDPVDAAAIPAALHEDDARECAYAALLDEIDSLLDPDPADPWPRHTEHSGASICVTLDVFRRAGGIPPVAVGEDRAFFAALRRVEARLRHPMDVQVTVSGRIHGRASGGMADTIRRRLAAPDIFLDDALEPAANRVHRVRLRAKIRRLFAGHGRVSARLLRELGCEASLLTMALDQNTFGLAWEMIESKAIGLARLPVQVAALPDQTRQAMQVLGVLREREASRVGGQGVRLDLGIIDPSAHSSPEMSRMAG